jgi:glycosyltransferase involved in cell wall biosynthesis
MRFHALGVQHTITSKEYIACAFTQKVLKFCSMMTLRGHTVIHYGHEDSEVECSEHVNVLSRQDYNRVYGEHDFRSKLFKFDQSDDAYTTFNTNAIREINLRKQPGDFLLAFWGSGHQNICQGAGEGMCVVEPGIGYPYGHFAEYKIFESYAMYHAFIKLDRVAQCVDINTWSRETVIPNYFDVSDFVDNVVPVKDRGDYFLFVGRIGSAKGVDHAIRMTERLGVRLIIAGQNADGGLKEVGMHPPPGHVEVIGHVDVNKRKTLMANAKAVVCMSTFAEPFCGVHVEAMMSGTPVITADWGAFTEFNVHGVTGFRCRTLDQMVDAGRRIHEIDPMACRKWAFDNFSTPVVAKKYEDFFDSIRPKSTLKVAVWCESKWALGRIGDAIKNYVPNVDTYDWLNVDHNRILWIEDKWKDYDYIISNTTLLTLEQLYGIKPNENLLKRLVIISHFPRFEGMHYFKETLTGLVDGPTYCGVSVETCEEMKKYGVKHPVWIPFGADIDVFPLTHQVTGHIKRIGIIGGKDRTKAWSAHEEYINNKGLNMFDHICKQGGFEPVYIHGMNNLLPRQLYENIDILICCSELEAGPLGIFEAASCGVPVLTRRVGNVQYIKGIELFNTIDEALCKLNSWNENIVSFQKYTERVTNEVRTNWSMKTLITKHLIPILEPKKSFVTYLSMKSTIDQHVAKIKEIVEASGEPCEGNVFWLQHDHQETSMFLNKRINLFNYSQKSHSIMEIGFNAGHSSLLYMLSNPTSTLQVFDLGEHLYTRPCFDYLSSQFPNRMKIEFGDSRQTVPAYISKNVGKVFDMIHVDGGHTESVVRADVMNTFQLCDHNTVIISDDDHVPVIHRINRMYLDPISDALPSVHQYVGRAK